jgi:FtsH-binding integral membrane protein
MHPFISGVFAVIYGLYLIVDTQMVLGKGQYSLSVDDYVVGALIIYLDIMMLFLELLSIFGDRS